MKNKKLILILLSLAIVISSFFALEIVSSAEKNASVNTEAVSTPYGSFTPLENQTPVAYPLAVFNPDKTLKGLYTNWKSAIAAAMNTENSVVYLRADVDRPDGEGGPNPSGFIGTLTVDLNGKTVTKADKYLFDIYLNSAATDATVVIKNGTWAHKDSESNNRRAFIQYNHGTEHTVSDSTVNFKFDKVVFEDNREYPASDARFLIVANNVDEGYKKIYGDIVFTDCEFYNNNSLTLFRGYDVNSRIDLSFTVNGGKILSDTDLTESVMYEASASGDSIVFGKGSDGNYITVELSGGATANKSLWNVADGSKRTLSKISESNGKAVYTLISDAVNSYVPKMSITLDSNFVLNAYVPVGGTQKIVFDNETYDVAQINDKVTFGTEQFYKISAELASFEAARQIELITYVSFDNFNAAARFTYSIPQYASKIISSGVSDSEKKLVKDALLYVGSAYTYFAKADAEPVNELIGELIGNHPLSYSISARDARKTYYISGATFILSSTPAVRFYISDEYAASDYTFYVNGRRVNDIICGKDSGKKYIDVSLYAYKMCGAVSYEVKGEFAGSYSISNYYSYVSKDAFESDKKAELMDLVRKFYNYSMSAADYFLDCNGGDTDLSTVDLSDFSVVYPNGAGERVIAKAGKLADALSSALRKSVKVACESDLASGKRIIVGNSASVCEISAVKLSQSDSEDAFIMNFKEQTISLFGKTESSTLRAVEYFIDNYIKDDTFEGTVIDLYDGASVVKQFMDLGNGVEIVVETESTVLSVVPGVYNGGLYPSRLSKAYYPSIVELKHNGENNGKLIAILAVNDTPTSGYADLDTNGCVMESSDGGKTWRMIARPMETIDTSIQGISMAHIYELPTAVGDMPEGTLLYSGNAVNYDSHSHIGIWRSFDCGYTWEEYTIVDAAGGTREGVWEPFVIYEESDGYLYCFYSDDSDPDHSQKLVYKRTSDGVNWSDATEVCAFNKTADRPGMLVMTKLGNGKYFIVYEYYGTYSGNIFYKTSDDISEWNEADIGTMLSVSDYAVGGGPACIWTPAGGENGMLIASGKFDTDGGQQHLLFVSFDYGNTWGTMENPLPYDITLDSKSTNRVGHSPSFIVGSDSSVIYYLNTTVVPETGYQRVQFAALRIYGSGID